MAINLNNQDYNNNNNKIVIIVVPYPAQSHLNMSFNLSKLISSYNIPIHYVSSKQHLKQLCLRNTDTNMIRSHDNEKNNSGVVFHEFYLPSCDNLVELYRTLPHLKQPVSDLIRDLSETYDKVVVIHDALMASVVESVRRVTNAQAYSFHTVSAFSMFVNLWRVIPEKPFVLDQSDVLPSFLPSVSEDCLPTDFGAFIGKQWALNFAIDAGTLYNGSRAIEGTYVGLLEKLYPMKKHFAVGPAINREFVLSHFNAINGDQNASKSSHKVHPHETHRCITWLDDQEKDSVIYISFGTTTSVPKNQIQELAIGLERSGHKFIWVLRESDKGDIFTNEDHNERQEDEANKVLPQGFIQRVGNKGMVISREWVPQLEILGHPSIGGFMTHCGWGSLTESMAMGVPVIACPIHSDQPLNSVLVTEVLKVGFLLRDDYWETRGQIVASSIFETAVKMLMGSEEGKGIRKRAKEVGEALRGSMAQDGASRLDIESFIAHITAP